MDSLADFRVWAANTLQVFTPLVGGKLERRIEDSFYLLPLVGIHNSICSSSSWRSHAFATRHSRLTVESDSPSTDAVSSIVKPLKNRSSTIRAWGGSSFASLFNASSSATTS